MEICSYKLSSFVTIRDHCREIMIAPVTSSQRLGPPLCGEVFNTALRRWYPAKVCADVFLKGRVACVSRLFFDQDHSKIPTRQHVECTAKNASKPYSRTMEAKLWGEGTEILKEEERIASAVRSNNSSIGSNRCSVQKYRSKISLFPKRKQNHISWHILKEKMIPKIQRTVQLNDSCKKCELAAPNSEGGGGWCITLSMQTSLLSQTMFLVWKEIGNW